MLRSRFLTGNLMLLSSMICAAGSQLLMKALLNDYHGSLASPSDWVSFLVGSRLVRTLFSIGMLLGGFVLWILALSRLDLSYAYPVASSSVVFVVFLGALLLGEQVTPRMYLGVLMIFAGIVLLMPHRA